MKSVASTLGVAFWMITLLLGFMLSSLPYREPTAPEPFSISLLACDAGSKYINVIVASKSASEKHFNIDTFFS